MKSIAAIYTNGVFRPDHPPVLPEGARVEVLLPDADEVFNGGSRFSRVIGAIPEKELEQIRTDIAEAFDRVDPDAWK
jgi:predicted DNA-binding antitoxin AbrB/MazE fold protein